MRRVRLPKRDGKVLILKETREFLEWMDIKIKKEKLLRQEKPIDI
jgi:hypothetical protein